MPHRCADLRRGKGKGEIPFLTHLLGERFGGGKGKKKETKGIHTSTPKRKEKNIPLSSRRKGGEECI